MGSKMKIFIVFIISYFILFHSVLNAKQGDQEKFKVAVLDFSSTEGVSLQEATTLSDRFRSMLVQVNTLTVLDRSAMKEILDEQGFQQSGCTTTDCAVEVGRLLNVQKMINGRIGKLGKTYTIDISFIDIKTAQIEKSYIKNYRGAVDGLLDIIQSIVNQIGNVATQADSLKVTEKSRSIIAINSDPQGAQIIINNKLIGKTPIKKTIRKGLHLDIKLQKENYIDWMKSVSTDEDINIEAKLEYTNNYKQELLQKAKAPGSGRETVTAEKKGGGKTFLWITGIAAVGGGVTYYILSRKDEKKVDKDIFPAPPDRPVK
jgi:hypothetical protein